MMTFPLAPKKPEAAKPEPKTVEFRKPGIGAFSIKTRLKTTLKDVAALLRSASFLEVAQEKDSVNALYVESRDINRQPYIFSILKANENGLELSYSIPPELGPGRRRLNMVRYFINMLTMLEPCYSIDDKIVLQLMETSIKDVLDSVSMDYSKLYTEYDGVKKEVEDLRKKVKRMTEENSALSNEAYELKNRNNELTLRVKDLENLSEEALKSKVQEWIIEHNGEINITEFSKMNNVSEVRVEEVLNRLITEGYIQAIQ
jgi:regulator of replication initiation timing